MALRLHETFPGTPESVAAVRRAAAEAARSCGMDDARVHAVRLAVSEAASNAVVHAYDGQEDPGEIVLDARDEGDELVVRLGDTGGGVSPRSDSPGLGLGLPLIVALTDRMEISDDHGATEVMMAFECPRADGRR